MWLFAVALLVSVCWIGFTFPASACVFSLLCREVSPPLLSLLRESQCLAGYFQFHWKLLVHSLLLFRSWGELMLYQSCCVLSCCILCYVMLFDVCLIYALYSGTD